MAQEEPFQGKRKSKPEFKVFAGKEKSMKKHKKIISLLLALVMVFSFMAMSASAASTIIPRSSSCPGCGAPPQSLTTRPNLYTTYFQVGSCANSNAVHLHEKRTNVTETYCRTCGTIVHTVVNSTLKVCPL